MGNPSNSGGEAEQKPSSSVSVPTAPPMPPLQSVVVSPAPPPAPTAISGSGGPGRAPDMPEQRRSELEAILGRFEISIANANDLAQLEDYKIMVIADDSGSMTISALLQNQRVLGQRSNTRWEELRETLSIIIDLGTCFDKSGIDVTFLNRAGIAGLTSPQDPRFIETFARPPNGSTPMVQTLKSLVAKVNAQADKERPILLIILTDGEPDEGPRAFTEELRALVKKQSTCCTFKVQIMACTGDDDAVGWLNAVDDEFKEVDVTDDFYSEKHEILQVAKSRATFTRGDWCMKAMLGPISQKFDSMDQGVGAKAAGQELDCFAGCDKGCNIQ